MNTFFYKDIAYPDGVIGGKDYYNPVIYSTNERLIGVWADNKPLYQKTVVFGSVSGTAASLPLNIANVDKIFLCADASSVNGIVPLSYVTGSNYNNNIGGFFDVAANNTNFEIRIGTAMAESIDSVIITAQYTKTTDTAGSAPYNNNGVPTIRYSTDEQIIGLWIDGKTLYQKTIPITKTGTATLVDISSLNIDMLTCCIGVEYPADKSFFLTLNYHENTNWYCFIKKAGNDLGVYCSNQDYQGAPYVLATIQYTKTTD